MKHLVSLAASISMCLALIACGGSEGRLGNGEPGSDGDGSGLAIHPSEAEVDPNGAVQFGATVAGTAPNGEVLWALEEPEGGTVSPDGTYNAPSAEGTYHVQALLRDGTSSTATVLVRRWPRVGVTVSPSAASISTGARLQLAATVTGTTNTAVAWSVAEGSAGGSITAAGLYTAPATAGSYHVVATSAADPRKSATATLTVTAPAAVTVAIAPSAASVSTGGTLQLAATVTGTTNTAVAWSVAEGSAGGSVTSSGLYSAPMTAGIFHALATSAADPTKSSTATITVTAPAPTSISVAPSAASVSTGATLQLTATVTGTTNTGVAWSVLEGSAGGIVTTAGLYTAPAVAGAFHVVATSSADPTKSATATLTVTAPAPVTVTVAPSAASIAAGGALQLAATVTGTADTAVTWTVQEGSAGGTVTTAGLYTAPAAAGTYHAVATSHADPSKWTAATITVTAPTTTGTAFYVSKAGNDANPGTLAQPFATLEKAQAAVRSVIAGGLPANGLTVYIRGGTYTRTSTLTLGSSDSGQAGKPIAYQAYPGEAVRLLGGVVLPSSGWSVVGSGDPLYSRTNTAARGNLMKIPLATHGVTSYGAYGTRGGPWRPSADATYPPELVFNGTPQTLARWPNIGASGTGIKGGQLVSSGGSSNTIAWSGGTLPSSLDAAIASGQAYLTGLCNDYDGMTLRITARSGSTLTLIRDDGGGWYENPIANEPFFVANVLEQLDTPGEYWLNTSNGDLYFWPSSSLSASEAIVPVLTTPFVTFSGASYVTFSGITFEGGRGDQVRFTSGSQNSIKNCTLRYAGRSAVRISSGATGSGVLGGEIAYPADYGVYLDGTGNYVRNANIHHTTRLSVNMYWPAIYLWGNGNTIANNVIHDLPDQAVRFQGANHLIEKNEIYNVNWYANDTGAIYANRRISPGTGNIIRYNYVHDSQSWWGIYAVGTGGSTAGIYLDDGWTDITVQGNILRNISHHGIHHGGGANAGANVTIQDNIIEKCGNQHLTAERAAYIASNRNSGTYPTGSVFRRNTIGLQNAEAVNGWSDMVIPYFTEYSTNLGNPYQGGGSLPAGGVDPRWVDPADPRKGLQSSSPVLAIPGWQPIPFGQIGIQ